MTTTRELVRVRIADSGGTMQDMSSLLGIDWLVAVDVDHSIDQMASTATITLRREAIDSGGTMRSLSPLISTYIAANRAIEIDYEVLTDLGTTPGTWTPLFRGHVDDAAFGGEGDTITIPCRDKAGRLRDVWIEDVVERGSDGTPTEIGTVMQTLLDAELGSKAPTLNVVGDPDFGIVAYDQQRESLASALEAHRDLIGWDLRYRYDPSTETFLLTFHEPDADQTTPDHTYSADDYFTLDDVEVQTAQIRNVVIVQGTLTNRNTYTTEVEDVYSIADLENDDDTGRRLLYIDAKNDPLLNTTAALDNLASAILRDTSQPPLSHVATQKFSPEIELMDLVRYEANGVHYDTDQDVAAVGITHRITRDERTTVVRARGKPAGGTIRWVGSSQTSNRRNRDRQREVPPVSVIGIVSPTVPDASTGDLTATTSGSAEVRSWRILASLTDITDGTLEAATPIDGQSLDTTDVGTLLAGMEPGDIANVAAIPYRGTGGNGDAGNRIDTTYTFGVDGDGIADGAFTSDKMVESAQRFGFTGKWTGSATFVSWSAGTFYLADGNTYSISSGSYNAAANIAGAGEQAYVYWDPVASTTAFQVTEDFADVNASDRNVLVAVTWNPGTVSESAETFSIVPVVGTHALDGQNINPESILADRIAANAITAAKISVVTLSAISADIGTLTAGVIEGANVYFDLDATSGTALIVGQYSAGGTAALGNSFVVSIGGDVTYAGDLIWRNTLGDSATLSPTDSTFSFQTSAAGTIADLAANRLEAFNATLFTVENSSGPIAIEGSGGVRLPGLPTTDPSVTGQLWNDSGTLKVSA